MAGARQTRLARLVRESVATGRFDDLVELLDAEAVLDTSNVHGRRRIAGPEAIGAHLAQPGPGDVVECRGFAGRSSEPAVCRVDAVGNRPRALAGSGDRPTHGRGTNAARTQ
jgi:hypothetical protein